VRNCQSHRTLARGDMKAVLPIILVMLLLLTACAVPLSQINGDRTTGVVLLQVVPEDAKVYLDGIYIGRASRYDGTHGTLRIKLGGHVLRFISDEFENEMREVVARETPQTLVVKMLPKPRPSVGE
jgi:hypothetical protein